MDRRELEKLRQRGVTASTSSGVEAVRLSAQYRQSMGSRTRQERRKILEDWERALQEKLAPHGGEIVPNSLSITGQTVEALVPVENVPSVTEDLEREDMRVDLVKEHQATQES